jgi:tryptophanyl-tRNA synthetase
MLTIDDFLAGEEATAGLYKKLGLQGKDFPTFFDANLTIADILLPCIVQRKERIMVFVGIEEHYFPKLANIVIERFNKNYLGRFVPENSTVTAVFGHVIQGLNGFPKMSKSIPLSSVNLDDTIPALRKKILNCQEDDEKIIHQMINLVSDWDPKKIAEANASFQKKGGEWIDVKKEYLSYFIRLKSAWEKTKNGKYSFKVGSLFK